LVNDSGLNPEQKDLFNAMSNILNENIPYFSHKSSVEKNKIVSKYYFYFMRHRHLVNIIHCSLPYSPLTKKEVEKEFLGHLSEIINVVNKSNVPVFKFKIKNK
jgi:hypothetical protein